MRLIRVSLFLFILGWLTVFAAGVHAGSGLLVIIGLAGAVAALFALAATTQRAALIQDLRYELGLLMLLLMVVPWAPPAQAYTVTGAAPWCTFNGYYALCFYYSHSACQQAARAASRETVCVPNPDARN